MKKLLAKVRRRLKKTINSRRHALLLVVLMHVAMAVYVLETEIVRDPEKAVLFDPWPPPIRATLWGVAGLLVALGLVVPKYEPFAFGVGVIMPMERVVGFLWAWAHSIIPGYPPGDPWSWGEALFWASLVAMIGLMATIVHSKPPPRRAE